MTVKIPFTDKRGRHVIIIINEEDYEATVKEAETGDYIGEFKCTFIEGADRNDPDFILIINMHLEGCGGKYKRAGIGTECVQLIEQHCGYPVVAQDDDGIIRDDGSHLTGDGPVFVKALRDRGIL